MTEKKIKLDFLKSMGSKDKNKKEASSFTSKILPLW